MHAPPGCRVPGRSNPGGARDPLRAALRSVWMIVARKANALGCCSLLCTLHVVTRPFYLSSNASSVWRLSLGRRVNWHRLVLEVPLNSVTISIQFACADSLSALRGVCRPERGGEDEAAVNGRPAVVYVFPDRPCVSSDLTWPRFEKTEVIREVRARRHPARM